ncbi:HsdM family class I SAM-dependent methyltransferase [Rhodanobacter ginsengiterrae]|uniref:HsdM family class I SAM-dependent methyltransferase n=1 Tax=Rhodanobacter ginsengiterrae TaxID=2008451 RepID=UPI003CF97458
MTKRHMDDVDGRTARNPRYTGVTAQKSAGATYTPTSLADFVAWQMLQIAKLRPRGPIRILDPSAGDGALLNALIKALPPALRKRTQVRGYDIDRQALTLAAQRLRLDYPGLDIQLEHGDFLDVVSRPSADTAAAPRFDLVIANPPYVRTQIMGARQAQQLAREFGLSGRVDLYYPFLLGISRVLDKEGVAGMITSNRFMSTRSGQAVRRELLARFRLAQVWDMGDSKPFEAAVLPSVLLARAAAADESHAGPIRFSSIYESRHPATVEAPDALSALEADDDSVVGIADGRRFHVRHGLLDNGGDAAGVWRLATVAGDHWLATVMRHTWATFRRIGKIRVGVKSTADKVFIRDDWDQLPGGRPELLRPLITRHEARRFKADPSIHARRRKEILYPHEVVDGRRAAVDLLRHPRAATYLEQHRDVLEARGYVIAAGRRWYELWVPQDPAAWSSPKLVFPDISEKPMFWMDTDGGVVNGECYWLQCEHANEEYLLWLALAVANSSFIEAFYDHRFNNKLYAGRRRFITQYVEQFPLPDPASRQAREIVTMVRAIHAALPGAEADQLARELDARIWQAFGLTAAQAPA